MHPSSCTCMPKGVHLLIFLWGNRQYSYIAISAPIIWIRNAVKFKLFYTHKCATKDPYVPLLSLIEGKHMHMYVLEGSFFLLCFTFRCLLSPSLRHSHLPTYSHTSPSPHKSNKKHLKYSRNPLYSTHAKSCQFAVPIKIDVFELQTLVTAH